MLKFRSVIAPLLLLLVTVTTAWADEGMWTLNNFPKSQIKQRYGFAISDAWLDHIRLSSVRFNNGGSGSFVSPDGMVMTNHHVGADCIQKLSTKEKDYIHDGFYAASRAAEAKCPDLELNVLVGIEEVTSQVKEAAKPGMGEAEINQAQKAAMSRLEKDCTSRTGLRCDIVTLYRGGAYNLYTYKKYTDVRLVFAPEFDIAFFGGDPDNFTYPRYNLDVAFFRTYENDKPARLDHYLRWSAAGPREGEVVFVSGNPGTTGRMLTLAQLEYLRDVSYPFVLKTLARRRQLLQTFAARGAEEERISKDQLFGVENSLKAYTGFHSGLTDKKLMAKKAAQEKELRDQIAADPAKQKEFGGAWEAIAQAQKRYRTFYHRYYMVERQMAVRSTLFALARDIVRLVEEKAKANEKRLREYRDSNLPSLEQELFSPAPIYDSLETVTLADVLGQLREVVGAEDPLARNALRDGTPESVAERLVSETKLKEVAVRKTLVEGGGEAVEASNDPMIQFARLLDPDARAVRKRFEDEVESVETVNGALISKALFATRGTSLYPDATFTLRLAYGPVKGYMEGGKKIPYTTTFRGLYERATGTPPYKLPKSFIEKKSALSLDTPFNFVATPDIHGGNSGSPVVNQAGEIVGLIFDGNIQSLPDRFVYTDEQARAVSVHSEAIIEALRKIYGAGALADELKSPGKQPGN